MVYKEFFYVLHISNGKINIFSTHCFSLYMGKCMIKIQTKWLDRMSYQDSLKVQQNFIRQSQDTGSCYLLGLEHKSVITLGLSAKGQDILVSSSMLKQKGITVVWTKRGGKTTCHSPGQLVIYPIVPLKKLQISIKEYVYLLEDVTRDFLKHFGIDCLPRDLKKPAAIYTQKGKIAFFGIQVQKGIASHGLAININNDLNIFSLIRSCGIDSEKMDSMSCYQKTKPSPLLLEQWSQLFRQYITRLYTK